MTTAIDVFCGTKSFAKGCQRAGIDCLTIDLEARHHPDLQADVLMVERESLPEKFQRPDMMWLSPPCTKFSVITIGRNWRVTDEGKHIPRNDETMLAMTILAKSLMLIKELQPTYWYLENPRDKMRSLEMMQPWYLSRFFGQTIKRHTVTYCQYGDTAQKPTDIWTNNMNWHPRPVCNPGDPCHEAAPRGSNKGTRSKKGPIAKAVVPAQLCDEVVAACLDLDKPAVRTAYVF